MSLICSTAETQSPDDVVASIFATDAHTLVFVLRGAEGCTAAPYTCAVFTSLSPHPPPGTPLQRGTTTIRDCLWRCAAGTAAANSAATATSPSACPSCARADESDARHRDGAADTSFRSATHCPSSAALAGSLEALRATVFLSKQATKTTDATSRTPGPAVAHLIRLHVVRQDGSARAVEVWCVFACGCGVLATFVLRSEGAGASVADLMACVWIPRCGGGGGTPATKEEKRRSAPCAVADAACTSLIRPCASQLLKSGETEGEGNELLLLCVCASPESPAAPLLQYTRLLSRSAGTAEGRATTRWRVRARGVFDMAELFRVPPPRLGDVNIVSTRGNSMLADGSRSFQPCSGTPSSSAAFGAAVRRVRWLPGTHDATHAHPLLAVLFAAPAVVLGDLCLDTLAVCYLAESDNTRGAAGGCSDLSVVQGRVLLGPWSVCGLTLAHPSFLFTATTAVTPPGQPPLTSPATKGKGMSTAAAAFRSARRAVAQAPMEVVGVFQRPAQAPYAASRLLRAACRRPGEAASGDGGGGSPPWEAKGNERAFAFVLYGAAGEAGRCPLDGYPECAAVLAVGSVAERQRGEGGAAPERWCVVARICTLLSGPTSAVANAPVDGCYTAVVLAITAQPTHGRRGDAGDDVVVPLRMRAHAKEWRCGGDGACRLSVHVTQRVSVSAICGCSLAAGSAALQPCTLLSADRLLCWCSVPAAPQTRGEAGLCVLVSGYASVMEGAAEILHGGVFGLSQHPPPSSAVGAAAPALNGATAAAYDTTVGWAQRCSAADLAQTLLLCSPLDTTSADLLSCAAFPALAHSSSTTVACSSSMLLVGLCWVQEERRLAASTPRAPVGLLTADVTVVALLRSGDVVGWRCSTPQGHDGLCGTADRVLRLGAVTYPKRPTTPSPQQERTVHFLALLFGGRAGPESVRMDLLYPESGGAAAVSTALLVIAVGPLIGVVRLCNGVVEHVVDVRVTDAPVAAAPSDLDTSAARLASAVVQFQRLPTRTPFATASSPAGEVRIGDSFSFLWTGIAVQNTSAPTSGGADERRRCVQSCVVHVGVVAWAEAAAATLQCLEGSGAATPQQPSAPSLAGLGTAPSLLHLYCSARWTRTEVLPTSDVSTSPDGSDTPFAPSLPCLCTGWLHAEGAAVENNAMSFLSSTETLAAPPLCLCDAALVTALWPGSPTRRNDTAASSSDISDDSSSSSSPCRWLLWSCHAEDSTGAESEEHRSTPPAILRRLLRRPLPAVTRASHHVALGRMSSVHLSTLRAEADTGRNGRGAEGGSSNGDSIVPPTTTALTNAALERVLFIASLPCTTSRLSPHAGTAQPNRCAVLCTVSVGAGVSPRRVASFLLCFTPSTADAEEARVQRKSPSLSSSSSFTWHWVPLPMLNVFSGGRDGTATSAAVGVSRILPIENSPATDNGATRTARDGMGEFYCEGVVLAEPPVSDTQGMQGCLVVDWERLWSSLERTSLSPTHQSAENMFTYAVVDSALLHWHSALLCSARSV